MWSNKALLAILWELNPNHELLLPAYLDGPRNMQNYVRKPLFGREGAGVTVFRNWAEDGGVVTAHGDDEKAARIFVPGDAWMAAEGRRRCCGSWMVDGEPAGWGFANQMGR